MYCSECGKKNPDKAKFCAYCGAKLLTEPLEASAVDAPEWEAESRFDAPEQTAPVNERTESANEWAKPVEPERNAVEIEEPVRRDPPKTVPPRKRASDDGIVRADHSRPAEPSVWAKPEDTGRARQAARKGAPSTIVPLHGRESEPEQDLFFDGYDNAPAPRKSVAKRSKQRKPSFIEQNLRGVIGIGMTLATLLILAAWLFLFPSGQQMLARFGLTDNPTAYAGIAQSAYDAQNYATAAQNYYQALLLDDDNYEYALMTAQCYQLAGSSGAASTALTMAIDINASDIRAYRLLQQIYPNAQTRPTAVTELLSQGATLTGDASLTQ